MTVGIRNITSRVERDVDFLSLKFIDEFAGVERVLEMFKVKPAENEFGKDLIASFHKVLLFKLESK